VIEMSDGTTRANPYLAFSVMDVQDWLRSHYPLTLDHRYFRQAVAESFADDIEIIAWGVADDNETLVAQLIVSLQQIQAGETDDE